MMSLPIALLFFLFLSCVLFSIIYSLVDNHTPEEAFKDFFANLKIYFGGLILCAVFVNGLQALFGQ